MDAEIKETEVDIVKLKADYETATADLAKANEKITSLEAEKAQLNEYIAKYVSSNTPSEKGVDNEPKTFLDRYTDCIREMEAKKD